MKVYRITTVKWSTKLTASGFPARWNPKGRFVLYTAATRALACLENVVHRSGEGLNHLFRVMVIDVPDDIVIQKVNLEDLPQGWDSYESHSVTQEIGDTWIENAETAVLQVPSAIIKQECNYLFNINHRDFQKVTLEGTEPFAFDLRIKE